MGFVPVDLELQEILVEGEAFFDVQHCRHVALFIAINDVADGRNAATREDFVPPSSLRRGHLLGRARNARHGWGRNEAGACRSPVLVDDVVNSLGRNLLHPIKRGTGDSFHGLMTKSLRGGGGEHRPSPKRFRSSRMARWQFDDQ